MFFWFLMSTKDVVMVNSPGFRPSLTSYALRSVTDVGLVFVRAPSLHRSSIAKPHNTSIKCYRVSH